MTRSIDVSDVKSGRKILEIVDKTAFIDIVKQHLLEVLLIVHPNVKGCMVLVCLSPFKKNSVCDKC